LRGFENSFSPSQVELGKEDFFPKSNLKRRGKKKTS